MPERMERTESHVVGLNGRESPASHSSPERGRNGPLAFAIRERRTDWRGERVVAPRGGDCLGSKLPWELWGGRWLEGPFRFAHAARNAPIRQFQSPWTERRGVSLVDRFADGLIGVINRSEGALRRVHDGPVSAPDGLRGPRERKETEDVDWRNVRIVAMASCRCHGINSKGCCEKPLK